MNPTIAPLVFEFPVSLESIEQTLCNARRIGPMLAALCDLDSAPEVFTSSVEAISEKLNTCKLLGCESFHVRVAFEALSPFGEPDAPKPPLDRFVVERCVDLLRDFVKLGADVEERHGSRLSDESPFVRARHAVTAYDAMVNA